MVDSDENFCGGDELWDASLTWWTHYPRFTRCFEWTVLTYVPSAFLWLVASLTTARTNRHKSIPAPLTLFNVTKTLVVLVMALCYLWSAAWNGLQGPESVPLAAILSDLINCGSCVLIMFIQYLNRKAAIASSPLVFSYWFLLTFVYLPRYYRVLVETFNVSVTGQVSTVNFVVTTITYPLIVTSFLLNCFSDSKSPVREKRNVRPSPVLTAPPFSLLVFEWISPFIIKGYKNYIRTGDLYDLLPHLRSGLSYKKWINRWDSELKRANYSPEDGSYDKTRSPRLFATLIMSFWPTISMAFLTVFLRSLIRSTPALVLHLITAYMTDPSQPLWKGVLYAFAIFATNTAGSFCFRHADYALATMGIKIKGILMAAIYSKALRISSGSQNRYTVGELVNLVSVDVDKVLKLCTSSTSIISCPVTIAINIYFLWQYLGLWPCMAGVAVIIVMMPISGLLASKNRALQERQMKLKDQRLKGINEILNSIKILKLFAWEPRFTSRVADIRKKEMSLLRLYAYSTAGTAFFWTCTPFFVGLVAFMTFVLISRDNILTPTVAFVSLTLFNQMRFSMVIIPDFVSNAIQTSVSFERIWNFLLCEEIKPHIIGSNPTNGYAITMRNVTASWGADKDKPVITDINLHVPKGKLVAIVGSVGSGKSSMLSAMLGDLTIQNGKIDVLGSIAYLPQQAWIQNLTIRRNIVFTSEFDRRRYDKVLDACSLRTDLDILLKGDRTEIGERGINISGGQKQRVALARAAYQNKEVYLLDDPLSAVDVHVGKAIFTNLIGPKGMLRKKTRVLVTNNLSVLPDVDYIIILKDGEIKEEGSYSELISAKGVLADLMKNFKQNRDEPCEHVKYEASEKKMLKYGDSGCSRLSSELLIDDKEQRLERFQFDTKETVKEGSIKLQVYVNFIKQIGFFLTSLTLFFFISFRSLDIVNGIWLSSWSENNNTSPENRDYRLGVYAGIGLLQGLCNFFGAAFLAKAAITASTNLHRLMLNAIMRAPLSFFDTTPAGRLLNRFGRDLDQLDVQLPVMANFTLEMLFQIIGMIVLISINLPIFLVVAIPVLILFGVLRQIFVKTLRQVKRLEAVTRSPVYSHFSETIDGLSSIRGFGVREIFRKNYNEKVDISQNCSFHVTICNYWMSLRLEFLGNIMIFAMVLLLVTNRDSIDSGTAGLLISYSLGAVVAFNFFVYFSTDVEAHLIAVERLDEYINIEPEAPWASGNPVFDGWPPHGRIEFKNYCTRYCAGHDLILRDINLTVEPRQKIGVVGRTGAGKSALILTIFRIIEAVEGKIVIDGTDISKIGLHELRSRLTIIPQESILFNSNLRFNLDPNDEYTTEQLWTALERVYLKQYFEGQSGLESPISESGGNLSVGQRQLVCLARAILRKPRILVLDEATAAVDLETDALIQHVIRKVFHDSTILTVAHRLNTILDSNIVVVIAAGQIVEMGPPQTLLANPQSKFYSMACEAGLGLTSVAPLRNDPFDESTIVTSAMDGGECPKI